MPDPQSNLPSDQTIETEQDLPLDNLSDGGPSNLIPGWLLYRLPWLENLAEKLESRSSFLVGLVVIAVAIGLSLYIGIPTGSDQLAQQTQTPSPSAPPPSRSVVPTAQASPSGTVTYGISVDEELKIILAKSSFIVSESLVFGSESQTNIPQELTNLVMPDSTNLAVYTGTSAYRITYLYPGDTVKFSFAARLALSPPWEFKESSRANRSSVSVGESDIWKARLTSKESGDGKNLFVEVIALKK